jgi:hypothetical protein
MITRFKTILSTPHSGADMANWINYIGKLLRTSVSVRELEAHIRAFCNSMPGIVIMPTS